jgi:tetratricopeptide (TPR) repeat protein
MVSGNNVKPAKNGKSASATTASTALPIKGGFSWNGASTQPDEEEASDSSSDESSDEEVEDSGKTGKKRKGGHQPIKDLTGEIRTKQPESSAEFERALLASPNSSYLWIQFMSFQLALSEIEKAKDIGRRALTTIAFREEEEKLNVWMALINLENAHGTPESFDKLFKEAAQYNDAKTVYLRTASVLQQTEKLDAAAEIFKKACKKFGQDSEPWTSFAEFEFVARDDADAARALLPRSLKSLPTSEREFWPCPPFRHAVADDFAASQTRRRLKSLPFSNSVMETRSEARPSLRVSLTDIPSDSTFGTTISTRLQSLGMSSLPGESVFPVAFSSKLYSSALSSSAGD